MIQHISPARFRGLSMRQQFSEISKPNYAKFGQIVDQSLTLLKFF